jgi:hypothetical protein
MADAGGLDFHQNLALFGVGEVHFHDFQRFACGNGDGGTGAHMVFPLFLLASGCAKPAMKSTPETTSGGKEHR